VANLKRRLATNVTGPWFVDDTCIDCDACRQLAPEVFGESGSHSSVFAQPQTGEQVRRAELALLACPVGSIGAVGHKVNVNGAFPQAIENGVSYCGFNAESSFGANAFLVERKTGNFLIDSPRFAAPLVREIEARGGIADILLTHRDDVADADKFARRFGARVWIHEWDADAAPFASHRIEGREPRAIRDDMLAIPVPGHTRGSVVFLLESKYLFTGDSLCWNRGRGDLHAFSDATWYSWSELRTSLAGLAAFDFEWVLAGHGDRKRHSIAEMRRRLQGLVTRMAS
jgi:glyoxylase-like metal-dependent hydrolase (beta-lactamase superfamily II)/ferredoxin